MFAFSVFPPLNLATSCSKNGRDVLSAYSSRLGSSQRRGDECFDFRRVEAHFPWGRDWQTGWPVFRSLAGAALSRSPLSPHYICSFIRLSPRDEQAAGRSLLNKTLENSFVA